jgi:hypothetical protein
MLLLGGEIVCDVVGFMFLVATAVLSDGDSSDRSGGQGQAPMHAPGGATLEHHHHHHPHASHTYGNSSAASGGLLWYALCRMSHQSPK